jgi:hypothetical protein
MTTTSQPTYSAVLGDDHCECSDPGCPAHKGKSSCERKANQTLWRVDMDDESGTRFCQRCADDAFDAGVFTDEAN